MQLTSSNYEVAIAILEEHFANTQQAAIEYMDSNLDMKKLDYRSAVDSPAGLRNLGYQTMEWDPIIIPTATRLFDNEILCIYEQNMGDLNDFPFAFFY